MDKIVYNTLKELYDAFDMLNDRCSSVCMKCADIDCVGFIWLLQEESEILINNSIEVLEINSNINFIHSFGVGNGSIDLSVTYPRCIFRCKDTGKCLIHDIRPLVCHMYPIGPITWNSNNMWVIHSDCEYVREMIKEDSFADYLCKAYRILSSINADLYNKITTVYNDMNYLANHDDDYNFCVIAEI